MTNCDKYIRNASEEEIADWRFGGEVGDWCVGWKKCTKPLGSCWNCLVEWLKQTAKDEEEISK